MGKIYSIQKRSLCAKGLSVRIIICYTIIYSNVFEQYEERVIYV